MPCPAGPRQRTYLLHSHRTWDEKKAYCSQWQLLHSMKAGRKTGTQCQVGQVWVVQSDIFNLKAGLQVTSHASRGWAPYIPAKTQSHWQALARVTVLQRAVIRFFAWGASSSTGTPHFKLLIIRCSKIESWYLKLEWLTQIFKFSNHPHSDWQWPTWTLLERLKSRKILR